MAVIPPFSKRSSREHYPDAQWVEVKSSAINALAFIEKGRLPTSLDPKAFDARYGSVLVEYNTRSVYEYPRQHVAVFLTLTLAESVGTAVNVLLH